MSRCMANLYDLYRVIQTPAQVDDFNQLLLCKKFAYLGQNQDPSTFNGRNDCLGYCYERGRKEKRYKY